MAGPSPQALDDAQALFLERWGDMGPAWGVSRTLSQIHALLMISPEPLNTDQVMEGLDISRGSAHTNLRELCDWGLVRRVRLPGDRKDYYEAEKDVWRVTQLLARQRRRREVEPTIEALDACLEQTKGLRGAEAKAFRGQLEELRRFAGLGESVLRKVESQHASRILSWIARFLK